MKITFLGTGTSTGIPELNCSCATCTSTDNNDKRLRSSILIATGSENILVDCGPDFRQQALRLSSPPIDAVLLTHEHSDHTAGLDDLRPYCRRARFPIYGEQNVGTSLLNRFSYCFRENINPLLPNFAFHTINEESFIVGSSQVIPIRVMHGHLPILGFRIGTTAYLTDILTIPDDEYAKLQGLDLLIMGALRMDSHVSHQSLPEAIAQVERIRPKKTLLTHFSHTMGLHSIVSATLPQSIELAYDGLVIEL